MAELSREVKGLSLPKPYLQSYDTYIMKHAADRNRATTSPSLWKSIIVTLLLAAVIVALFGVIIFFFVSGAQRLGLSTAGYVSVLIIISGIFAWLLKRISDTASEWSHLWFSEEGEERE